MGIFSSNNLKAIENDYRRTPRCNDMAQQAIKMKMRIINCILMTVGELIIKSNNISLKEKQSYTLNSIKKIINKLDDKIKDL